MRYLALCCDYDGTIAHHGRVDEPTLAALEAPARIGPQARARHRPRARRAADGLPAPRSVRPRRRGERRTALPARDAARSGCSTKRRRRLSSTSCIERGVGPISVGRVHRRDVGAAREDGAGNDPRLRARAAGHLQQGRGDGAARGRQQGDRAARRARRAESVAAQRRRRRRRGERSRLPQHLRMLGRGRERAAGRQGRRRTS